MTWLKLGDNSTSYFHSFASQRRSTNHISKIEYQDSTLTCQFQILESFTNYYNEIMGPLAFQNVVPMYLDQLYPLNPCPHQLNALQNNFSANEIQISLLALAKGKSCGPHDIPSEFFQLYGIFNPGIAQMIMEFQANRLDL